MQTSHVVVSAEYGKNFVSGEIELGVVRTRCKTREDALELLAELPERTMTDPDTGTRHRYPKYLQKVM